MKNKFLVFFIAFLATFAFMHYQNKIKNKPIVDNIPIIPDEKPITPSEPPPIETKPSFVNVPVIKQTINEDSVYADIMNRYSNPVFGHGRSTNAHETTHMINNEYRNKLNNYNFCYVRNGNGMPLEEPKMTKNQIKEFVPQILRFYRFNTYLENQGDWNKQPLYIFDEWSAYVNDAHVSVEDAELGKKVTYQDNFFDDKENEYTNNYETLKAFFGEIPSNWTDGVSGALEFSIYAVATCMAIEKNDPTYWNGEKGKIIKTFVKWHLKEAQSIYQKGNTMPLFTWEKQDKLLNDLKTSDSAKNIRDFTNKHFDGLFLN